MSPLHLERSRERLFRAGLNILRAAVLLGTVLALFWSRGTPSLFVPLPVAAGAALCLSCLFGRNRNVRGLTLFLILYGAFVSLRSLADETGIAPRYEYVIDLERAIFGVIPSAWLQQNLYEPAHRGVIDVVSAVIYFSYFVLMPAVAVSLWLRRSKSFPVFTTAVLVTIYIGLLTSALLPTAPPWLASDAGLIPETSRVVRELMSATSAGSFEAGHAVAGPNEVAAMPSLHVAITVLIALTAASLHRAGAVAGWAYAASMVFALCYLGEHYIVDIAAGAFTAGLAWTIASRVWGQRAASAMIAPEPSLPAALPAERAA